MRTTTRTVAGLAASLAVAAGLLAACGDDDTDAGGATTSEDTTAEDNGEAEDTASDTTAVIDPGDGGDYNPQIDPANFVDVVDNPYFPLPDGARWVYEGTSEGETERIEVIVTGERRTVMGVSAWVVRDTVSVDGEVTEDTYDWYAQDRDGNVWYLGEDTAEYEDGEVTSREGSWEAGVDGALPGIVMLAHPQVGDAYRQEFYEGEAEDLGEVLQVGISHRIAIGEYTDVLVTEDWNPFEPEVVENKYYAPGVGVIFEGHTAGGDDRIELIEFTPGS